MATKKAAAAPAEKTTESKADKQARLKTEKEKAAAVKAAEKEKADKAKAAAKAAADKGPGKIEQIIALHKKGKSNQEIVDAGFNKTTVAIQVAKYKKANPKAGK